MIASLSRKVRFIHAMGLSYLVSRLVATVSAPTVAVAKHLREFCGTGLEIGGPSAIFRADGLLPVYPIAAKVDNITYSSRTRWEGAVTAGSTFRFDDAKAPGTQYILDSDGVSALPVETYDFVLSSHMLEHTSNPLKMLDQWKKLLRRDGRLLLVLPHKEGTFDHRRPVTRLAHLQEDRRNDVGEDDDTHIAEILQLHDLRRDPEQASREDFERWIRDNATHRGAHHHVFDVRLAIEMLDSVGFQIVDVTTARPCHIILLAKRPADRQVDNSVFLRSDASAYRASAFSCDRRT